MINSTIRTIATAALALSVVAASGIAAQAKSGHGGGKGGMAGNGMGIYFANQAVNNHNRKLDCSYRNKWIINQHNQLVLVKVQHCHR